MLPTEKRLQQLRDDVDWPYVGQSASLGMLVGFMSGLASHCLFDDYEIRAGLVFALMTLCMCAVIDRLSRPSGHTL